MRKSHSTPSARVRRLNFSKESSSSDSTYRLVWKQSGSNSNRAADVTVFTTFVLNDVKYMKGWMQAVGEQISSSAYVVELVIGAVSSEAGETIMQSCVEHSSNFLNVKSITITVWEQDPGLYQMWDYIITLLSTAPTLSNWNIDDRKAKNSLSRKLDILNVMWDVDVVSSQVVKVKESAGRYPESSSIMYDLASGLLKLEDFFKMRRLPSGALEVYGSRNVPHNAPVWRKRVHEVVGYFTPRFEAGCWDYSFWLKAIAAGIQIYHINEPLEFYLHRLSSYGHRSHLHSSMNSKNKNETGPWKNPCDSRETWDRYMSGLRDLHHVSWSHNAEQQRAHSTQR
jgi:hypothetical protein